MPGNAVTVPWVLYWSKTKITDPGSVFDSRMVYNFALRRPRTIMLVSKLFSLTRRTILIV